MTEAQNWIQALQRRAAFRHRKRRNQPPQPEPSDPKTIGIHYLYPCHAPQKAYIDVVGTSNQGEEVFVMVQGESRQRLMACCRQIEPHIYQIRDDTPTYLQIIRKEKTPFSLLHHGTIAIGSEVFEMTLMHSRKQFEPELVIGSRQSG
jgi:hypothetical protein